MSKDLKRILIAILSFIIWPVGIVLYFVYGNKKDAKLFGLLGLIGAILTIVWRIF
jgi:hypothetical protein